MTRYIQSVYFISVISIAYRIQVKISLGIGLGLCQFGIIKRTLTIGGRITEWLTSCLFCLDLAALRMFNEKQFYFVR